VHSISHIMSVTISVVFLAILIPHPCLITLEVGVQDYQLCKILKANMLGRLIVHGFEIRSIVLYHPVVRCVRALAVYFTDLRKYQSGVVCPGMFL